MLLNSVEYLPQKVYNKCGGDCMDKMNTEQKILQRMDQENTGSIFINADFLDIVKSNTLRKSLKRLVDDNKITRILDGMYTKLEFSRILNKQIYPSPVSVAHAIARKFNWSIFPSKNTALNMVGLSTQISNTYEFLSDGPYRNYTYINSEIIFKKSANKKIKIDSDSLVTLVVALDSYGKSNINLKEINIITSYIIENKITIKILEQNKTIPGWMYQLISDILKKEAEK